MSIEILPLDITASLRTISSFKLGADGTFADDTTNDMAEECTWQVQNTRIATISNVAGQRGIIRFLRVGTTVVTASKGNVSAARTVTVTN